MNKSIAQQIFYGFSVEIRVAAGGRGGNTIGILLPGVGEERVTGLEEGVKFFLAKRSIFQTIWRGPYSDGGHTQVSILPDTIKAYHDIGSKGSAILEARRNELRPGFGSGTLCKTGQVWQLARHEDEQIIVQGWRL